MLKLRSVFGTKQELAGLLSNSSEVATDGLNTQVGRSMDAQTLHVSQSVLNSCSVLNNFLVPGCRIVNADPAVFAIIIEHLQFTRNVGSISSNAPGHLQELVIGNDPLLNFAKAWHVGDMLLLPDLQNDIFGVYRTHYRARLDDRLHLPLDMEPLGPQPFTYLRDNTGNHTKAKRFLVDFHAGLMQYQAELKRHSFEMLPTDIADKIRNRWKELRARRDSIQPGPSNDRIAVRDRIYKVTNNETIVHSNLQIQYLYAGVGIKFGLNPPMTVLHRTACQSPGRNDSCHGTRLEGLIVQRKSHQAMSSSDTTNAKAPTNKCPKGRNPPTKPTSSRPFAGPASQQGARPSPPLISPMTVPSEQQTAAKRTHSRAQDPRNQAAQQPCSPPALELPSQAPFVSDSPGRSRWSYEIGDSENTDEESVYNLFAPGLRSHDLPSEHAGQPNVLGILHFAA